MARFKIIVLAVCLAGAIGCAPKELFSGIDRNCFVADWTNAHSCLSCRRPVNHRRAPAPYVEPLVLGKQPVTDQKVEQPTFR